MPSLRQVDVAQAQVVHAFQDQGLHFASSSVRLSCVRSPSANACRIQGTGCRARVEMAGHGEQANLRVRRFGGRNVPPYGAVEAG